VNLASGGGFPLSAVFCFFRFPLVEFLPHGAPFPGLWLSFSAMSHGLLECLIPDGCMALDDPKKPV